MNGKQYLADAVADHGGIKIAYNAYEAWVDKNGEEPLLPGLEEYSPRQLFWITFACTHCTKYRSAMLKQLLHTDCHLPAEFRVNIPLRNEQQFARDFNCPVNTYMNPPVKYNIW